jgi:hypothetical protein
LERKEVYKEVQDFLKKRECYNIPLSKEGLVVRRPEADYIIKITKKKFKEDECES